ncbi:MAG: RNA-directed DNA polymerase [Candidatus Pacebacteria bacterium]|nr:RNA-directed DNA polymerase [Candidatus Paceibacterota bacterium]
MLDQNFSEKNIEKIYQYGRRQGIFSDEYFSGSIKKELRSLTIRIKDLIRDEIKPCIDKIKKAKKAENLEEKNKFEKKLKELNQEKKELYAEKIEIVSKYIIKQINFETFNFSFVEEEKDFNGKNKKIYKIMNLEDKFVMKHIQRIFEKTYKVKQANRYLITSQIKNILDSKLNFYIFKTDIKEFYETIDSNILIKKIKNDNLFSPDIKRILENLLIQSSKVSSEGKGILRGLGISAFLSELYLRTFDKIIKSTDGVIFYGRYVDDILIISTKNMVGNSKFKDFFTDKLKLDNFRLEINKTKTKEFNFNENIDFDYLGYRFFKSCSDKRIKIDISDKRYKKYKRQINNIFNLYEVDTMKYGVCRSLNELVLKRVKYITLNTRIEKKGKKIYVGMHFNNLLITEKNVIISLDEILVEQINKSILLTEKMKNKLKKCKFTNGYDKKHFFVLASNKRYEEEKNNDKKIKDISKIISVKND